MAERPIFQKCLDNIHKVRAMRRPRLEAAAANSILERLLYITQCNLDSASAMKECRLAIKQIVAILNPETKPTPATHTAPNASEGMVPQDATPTTETTTPPTTSRAHKEATAPASQTNASEKTSHSETTPTRRAPNANETTTPPSNSEEAHTTHTTHITQQDPPSPADH